MDLKEFGRYFAELRKESGFKSQRQLALKSEVSNGTIARIESGTHKATPDTLFSLCKHLKGMPYMDMLAKLGYLKTDNETEMNEILKLEHYRRLLTDLSNLVTAKRREQSEIFPGIEKEIIEELILEANSVDIEIKKEELEEKTFETVDNILREINIRGITISTIENFYESDIFKRRDELLFSQFDPIAKNDNRKKEQKLLENEKIDESIEDLDFLFFKDDISSEEELFILKFIKAALITQKSGFGSYYLNDYLNAMYSSEKIKKVLNEEADNTIRKKQEHYIFNNLLSSDPEILEIISHRNKLAHGNLHEKYPFETAEYLSKAMILEDIKNWDYSDTIAAITAVESWKNKKTDINHLIPKSKHENPE